MGQIFDVCNKLKSVGVYCAVTRLYHIQIISSEEGELGGNSVIVSSLL
jgi:hypothetical protein